MPPWGVRGQKYGHRDRHLESRVSQLALGRALCPAATTSRDSPPPGQTGLPRVLEHCAHHTWAPPKTTLWGLLRLPWFVLSLLPKRQRQHRRPETGGWEGSAPLSRWLSQLPHWPPCLQPPSPTLPHTSFHRDLSNLQIQPCHPTVYNYTLASFSLPARAALLTGPQLPFPQSPSTCSLLDTPRDCLTAVPLYMLFPFAG